MPEPDHTRKSKQNCLSIINPLNDGAPGGETPKSPSCNVSFSFEQLANLITTLTSDFTGSIKMLVDKFESLNVNKLDNLESQLSDLNNKYDSLKSQVQSLSNQNDHLRQLLGESYISQIKQQEEAVSNDFVISGFTELVALDSDSQLKLPQDLMNCF
jgi:regulator of replication initiation timing